MWSLCHVFEDTLYLICDLMEDSAVPSNLSVPKVSDSDQAATSARAKKSPKPGEHVQLFHMKRDRNKGFYSEKCYVEVSIALCFEWAGCLVPRDALPSVHNIVARTEHCVQRTLPIRTVFFWDIIIRWTRGGGGYLGSIIRGDECILGGVGERKDHLFPGPIDAPV